MTELINDEKLCQRYLAIASEMLDDLQQNPPAYDPGPGDSTPPSSPPPSSG